MKNNQIKIFWETDVGLRRLNNEDCIAVDREHFLIVLADGMGGHKAGEVASHMAANSVLKMLRDWLEKVSEKTVSRNLKKATVRFINKANYDIYRNSLSDYEKKGMGTTLVVGVFRKGVLTVAHVGDSRAYLFRNGRLQRLTDDHTKAQEQLNMGLITAEEFDKSPHRHLLTRAVGVSESVEVDINQIGLKPGDKILFCSDGLTDMLSENYINDILMKDLELELSIGELIRLANDAGGLDNISLVLAG
jgi:serine/threonine protein phosphatase PrpC